jgi:hypothetical protein
VIYIHAINFDQASAALAVATAEINRNVIFFSDFKDGIAMTAGYGINRFVFM